MSSQYVRTRALHANKWPNRFSDATLQRPYARYLLNGLIGGLVGYLILVFWSLTPKMFGLLTMTDSIDLNQALEMVGNICLFNLFWFPVVFTTALFTAVHLDTVNDRFRDRFIGTVGQGLIAWGIAWIFATGFVEFYRTELNLNAALYAEVEAVFVWFVALLVLSFGSFMGFFLPRSHIRKYRQRQEYEHAEAEHQSTEESAGETEIKVAAAA